MEKEQRESTEDFIDKLLEQDVELQEFDINKEWVEKEREKEMSLEWDDDDIKDDFTLQLKKELENNSRKELGNNSRKELENNSKKN